MSNNNLPSVSILKIRVRGMLLEITAPSEQYSADDLDILLAIICEYRFLQKETPPKVALPLYLLETLEAHKNKSKPFAELIVNSVKPPCLCFGLRPCHDCMMNEL